MKTPDGINNVGADFHAECSATVTPSEQFAYLLTEHMLLGEEHRRLMRTFATLKRARPSNARWKAHRRDVQAHKSLLANHRIALEWMRHPPCGRIRLSA